MWTREAIVSDLKILEARGEEPDIYQLKAKYGYTLNSEFFPLLEDIRTSTGLELTEFIDGIFARVEDPRDLNFRYGECHCSSCQDDD